MKKVYFAFGAAMAAIFALSSCNKEISDPNEIIKDGIPFEINASSVDTKTSVKGVSTKWVADDAINLFHAVAGTTDYESDGSFSIAAEDLETGRFTGTLNGSLEGASYDWYAFYPYDKNISTPANQGTKGYVTVGGKTQTQTGNSSTAHLCKSVCPLYGIAKGVASNETPNITMNHLTSIVEVKVTNNSGSDLTVSSVSFTGTEDIVGTYFIDFTGSPINYKSSGANYVSTKASLSVENGAAIENGASATFYIAIKPFTAANGTKLTVSVNGFNKDINLTKDVTFTAGKIKTINFNYDKIYVPQVYALVETDGAFVDNGKYVLALKDGKDGTYYFINNAGASNNLSKNKFTVVDGKITDPDLAYVFTAKTVSGGFALSNINGKYICNTSSTTINTNYDSYTTWVPTFLTESKCYKISNGSNTGRYISYATKETEIKAYLNESYKDQIANNLNVCQYAGAISLFTLYDPTAPMLSVTPTLKTWASEEVDAAVFTVTTNTEGENDWSVSPTTLDWATIDVDKNAGTITVTPNDANATETAREATLTVSHSAGTLSKTITLKQKAASAGGEETPVVGTVLWSDSFGDWGEGSTSFTEIKTTISTYDYRGRSGYKDNASVTLTASNDYVKGATSSGANMTSGHLWFCKSQEASVTTSAIILYGATKVTLSFAQGGSKSSITPYYSLDSGTSWTSLSATTDAGSEHSYTITTNGNTSILLKFTHLSTNTVNTRVDNFTLTVAE